MKFGAYNGKLDAQAIWQIKDLYREGWNIAQLADRYNVSRQAIWKTLKRRGIAIRPRHRKQRDRFGRYLSDGGATTAERDEWGCIVTVREQTTRELRSLHAPGKRGEALRYLAERIDRMPGDWRVLCYSTPETITGDLNAKRLVSQPNRNDVAHLDCIEANALGKVGRIDLLDPELSNGHASRTGRRKKR